VVADFTGLTNDVAKLVGVSDDLEAVRRCEQAVQERFSDAVHAGESNPQREPHSLVSAARSQPYYLDVTHPDANKGYVVRFLSERYGIPAAEIATMGDGPNDVLMFAPSGMSIAMGNADPEVQRAPRTSPEPTTRTASRTPSNASSCEKEAERGE
jgi:hydroxymethylpyrimidine pyrophosphatase-like HAD family hydrolase